MPIQLKTPHGTSQLNVEGVLQWLREESSELPKHVGGNRLGDFLRTRDKTYESAQQQDFLADFSRYYETCRTLEDAIQNLMAYGDRLASFKVDERLVSETLGAAPDHPLSESMLKFAYDRIAEMHAQERKYVEECLLSLQEQLAWHHDGPVDKGEVSKDVRKASKAKTASDQGTPSQLKDVAKLEYYEPIRNRLMNQGFIVSPRGTALGAIFPEKEWVDSTGVPFFDKTAKRVSNTLMQKYDLMGDSPTALIRLLMPKTPRGNEDPLASAVGCICVSWTRHDRNGRTLYVPVLGLSGVIENKADAAFFEKTCRHLGLPVDLKLKKPKGKYEFTPNPDLATASQDVSLKQKSIKAHEAQFPGKDAPPEVLEPYTLQLSALKTEKKQLDAVRTQLLRADVERRNMEQTRFEVEGVFHANYKTMIKRTNLCAIQYRARQCMDLRKPSRQALMSYVAFREDKGHKAIGPGTLQSREWQGVDLSVCFWHSFNCAEPAALICASSFFAEGCDVEVCFPYEGLSEAGPFKNRPKETCPWCATVELGFRSVSRNVGGVESSLGSGKWKTQVTRNTLNEPDAPLSTRQGFDAFDDANPIMQSTAATLGGGQVRNKDLEEDAYGEVVQTKIGRIRSMYYLLGLMDPEVIALDRPVYRWRAPDRFKVNSFQ